MTHSLMNFSNTRAHRVRLSRLLIALVAAAVMLSGCESLPSSGGRISDARAQRLLDQERYDDAADVYAALANSNEIGMREHYLLLAARAWINAGDEARAQAALSQVAAAQGERPSTDYTLANAAMRVLEGDGNGALLALAQLEQSQLSLIQRIDAEGSRGDAYFLMGEPLAAVTTLQRREVWLSSNREIERNHQRIWDGLLQSSPESLLSAQRETRDRTVIGWLQLGALADGTDPRGAFAGLAAWQRAFAEHPAHRYIIPGIGPTDTEALTYPRKIAVLLSLSGRVRGVTEPIRDGLLGQYAETMQGRRPATEVVIYDISQSGVIVGYEQALADGAEFVIGPLMRSAVDELAQFGQIRVPTLTLNYLSPEITAPLNLYQFGLAPEDEAAQTARHAIAEGYRRAIALTPASSWGERVLQAFNDEFQRYGGELLSYQTYATEQADFRDEIQNLLLLSDSVSRYRTTRSLLGGALQFEPRRRADADFIFMAANAANGRQIKPQLRFHYAGDLPVYATSAVYSPGDGRPNNDLEGVSFADLPWLINPTSAQRRQRDLIEQYWPTAQAQPRLFALGADALSLVQAIMLPVNGERANIVNGATGDLHIDNNGRVVREMGMAQFSRGEIIALPALPKPNIVIFQDIGETLLMEDVIE